MSKKTLKPVSFAVGTVFVATLAANNVSAEVVTDDNPFAMSELSGGYMQLAYGGGGDKSDKKDKYGEGNCGGKKAKEEGKCGEGKCGEDMKKNMEGNCGGKKAEEEGKCGEGKCGSSK
ncbi:hypothetical protein SAMN05421690_102231 [Nitrosomonas sp. Nm51]|uniref:HvfA family oxazolone/thioamide-modified RiPP metallophore n=1 Tax=Nitrosomonas sp. Nm51 TaxID=133720 RepID=UPI0008D1FD76|nr:hypothetical protein [Nitrosomonas sp. Nm51]SER37712.1 hypothetical protein SAMN05421690_102231 [Nitrosomonas sp. Nm51]